MGIARWQKIVHIPRAQIQQRVDTQDVPIPLELMDIVTLFLLLDQKLSVTACVSTIITTMIAAVLQIIG